MTDEELYEQAKAEGEDPIVVYATSSKMLKVVDDFQEAYPGLTLEISDLDNDEVLQKAKIEAENNNVVADVLQVKDSSGDVFYDYYEDGYIEPFYPQDISEKIAPDALKYGYPLYASQSMWYYNTEIFPDGQPVTSWWNFVEKNEDGSYKYKIFTKEIGKETTYLALFAEFINHADEMAQAYKDLYGTDLEYTYDSSVFTQFQVPENNAGVEYLWRFSQMVQDGNVTFIGEGAFVGCNTTLVAPVTLGQGAYIGAGSVITEDIPAQALGISRPRLQTKKEWAAKHKKAEETT